MANRYLAGPAGTARTQYDAGRALGATGAAAGARRIESPVVANP